MPENQVTAGNPTQLFPYECDKCHETFEISQSLIDRITEAKKDNPKGKVYCSKCSDAHLNSIAAMQDREQHGEPDDYY